MPVNADTPSMNVSNFPASATGALIEGYRTDVADLEFMLTETLEQVSARGINSEKCLADLEAIEASMLRAAGLIRAAIELSTGQPSPDQSGTQQATSPNAASPAQVAQDQVSSDQVSSDQVAPSPGAQSRGAQSPVASDPSADAENSLAAKLQRNAPPMPQQGGSKPTTGLQAAGPQAAGPQANGEPSAAQNPRGAMDADASGPIRAAMDPSDAPGEVSLCGNNMSMPIASVFQFLENAQKHGTLTVQLPGETLTFGFREGLVTMCDSTNRDLGDRLGDILTRTQCHDTVRLVEMIEAAAYEGSPELGELLVQEGLATNGQVMDALEEQARRRYRRACESGQAIYEFLEREVPSTDGRIRLSPMELAFESRL